MEGGSNSRTTLDGTDAASQSVTLLPDRRAGLAAIISLSSVHVPGYINFTTFSPLRAGTGYMVISLHTIHLHTHPPNAHECCIYKQSKLPSQIPVTRTCDTLGPGTKRRSRWTLHQAHPATARLSTKVSDPIANNDKLHPQTVSLRSILCVLKHKTQPRAIFPVQSKPWVPHTPCFLR